MMLKPTLVLAATLACSAVALAQSGAKRDLRQDRIQLDHLQQQLNQDKFRLAEDRRRHAPKSQIRGDKFAVQNDQQQIRALKADMKRDRQQARYGRYWR